MYLNLTYFHFVILQAINTTNDLKLHRPIYVGQVQKWIHPEETHSPTNAQLPVEFQNQVVIVSQPF